MYRGTKFRSFAATAMPVDTVVTGTIAKQEAPPVFLAENLL